MFMTRWCAVQILGSNDRHVTLSSIHSRIDAMLTRAPPTKLVYTFPYCSLHFTLTPAAFMAQCIFTSPTRTPQYRTTEATGSKEWTLLVEMDDPVMAHWADIVKRSDSQWADADKESELLLVRIKERVAELERRRRARDFFLGYARDPVWFFHKCLDSQARDLQVRVTQARAHTCMAALTPCVPHYTRRSLQAVLARRLWRLQ